MDDIIPQRILNRIAAQYERRSIVLANAIDIQNLKEDALTASLGTAMSEVVKGRRLIGAHQYKWTTNTWVLGSHSGGPATEYGADALIEFEVRDASDAVLAKKILPFQAKKGIRIAIPS